MIKLILGTFKLAVFTLVISLINQVPIGNKRICDYVGDITKSQMVQGSVKWISTRVDFNEGHRFKINPANQETSNASTKSSDSDLKVSAIKK